MRNKKLKDKTASRLYFIDRITIKDLLKVLEPLDPSETIQVKTLVQIDLYKEFKRHCEHNGHTVDECIRGLMKSCCFDNRVQLDNPDIMLDITEEIISTAALT